MIHRGNGVYGTAPRNRGEHNHGLSKTAAHRSWIAMIQRCHNDKSSGYVRYGAIGIGVCERWKLFANFFADMGDRPAGRSLERINPALGYSKENCRWATITSQARNKRNTLFVSIDGVQKSLAEWAEIYDANYCKAWRKIKLGMAPINALLEAAQ